MKNIFFYFLYNGICCSNTNILIRDILFNTFLKEIICLQTFVFQLTFLCHSLVHFQQQGAADPEVNDIDIQLLKSGGIIQHPFLYNLILE